MDGKLLCHLRDIDAAAWGMALSSATLKWHIEAREWHIGHRRRGVYVLLHKGVVRYVCRGAWLAIDLMLSTIHGNVDSTLGIEVHLWHCARLCEGLANCRLQNLEYHIRVGELNRRLLRMHIHIYPLGVHRDVDEV